MRELANVLERALTLCVGGVITADHIKLRSTQRTASPAPLAVAAATNGAALGDHLEEIEKDAIVKALEKTRYNKTAAAKLLGMSFRAGIGSRSSVSIESPAECSDPGGDVTHCVTF